MKTSEKQIDLKRVGELLRPYYEQHRNEEKLQATMTDKQKELFEKYTNCVQEDQTITDCLIFQNSFKLGARMMLQIMEE